MLQRLFTIPTQQTCRIHLVWVKRGPADLKHIGDSGYPECGVYALHLCHISRGLFCIIYYLDFSTLYTTLPHKTIKDKLVDLIERMFQREYSLYIACNDRHAFFTTDAVKYYNLWSCQKVCEALTFLLDNIYIRFGSNLYRQIVGIPMGINCAPLVTDLFLFCYERDFMLSLSDDNQSEVIEVFTSTSRYLDDLLNIDNTFFDSMVNRFSLQNFS